MLACEVLVNFNKAFYKDGIIYDKRMRIANNYLRSDFVMDLLLFIPYLIKNYNAYFNLLSVFRLYKSYTIFERYEESTTVR